MDAETTAVTTETAAPIAESPAPPPAPEAKAPPAADPEIQVATMSLAAYNALLAKQAELDRRLAEEAAKAREAERRAMEKAVEAGDVKKVLETLTTKTDQEIARIREEERRTAAAERERILADQKRIADEKAAADNARTAIEARAKKFALDGELGRALASHNLVDGAADDLTALLRNQFTVEPDGDSFAVRSQSGQSVAEFVKGYLERKPHYVKSGTNRGGTIGSGGSSSTQPPPAAPAADFQPKNLGEWAAMQARARAPGSAATGGFAAQGIRPVGR